MIQSHLLKQLAGFIGGKWVFANSGKTLPVLNPATGEQLGDVPDMGAEETTAAIEAAAAAMCENVSLNARQKWLTGVHDLLLANKDELARIITLEQGKPLRESAVEVEYSAGFFHYFAGAINHLRPEPLPQALKGHHWTIHHRPAGVAALITPWNFPLAMIAKKLAPAIAAGCAVVAKPADLTPLTAIALWNLIEALEYPAARLNLVIGKPVPIGDVLCEHPDVRVISFTGSTAVGKHLIARTAAHVKRLALELGGNAPFIVMDDANIDAAADALIANKFRAAGQTCVCANRIYVQNSIADRFERAVADRVARLRPGNGQEPSSDIGPLINRAAFEKVSRHVNDALRSGAKKLVGAETNPPEHNWGAFFPPTVLRGVTPEMAISREETFGPVVAITTFDGEDEGIRLANQTPYGLAGYVFTSDSSRGDRIVSQLRFGHVGLNTGMGPTPEAPFGGMKQSGFGREGGIEGLMEFCESQTVASK